MTTLAPYRYRTGPPTGRGGKRHTFQRIGTATNDWAALQALVTAHYDLKDL